MSKPISWSKLFLLAITVIFIIFIIAITKSVMHNRSIAEKKQIIPFLTVETINGNNKDWFDKKKKVIIIFFNSLCQSCIFEVDNIKQNISLFYDVNLIFISDESKQAIHAFSKISSLRNRENIWWLKMQPEDVYKTFGSIGIPHIWIYDKDGKLVKEFRGLTRAETLLKWL